MFVVFTGEMANRSEPEKKLKDSLSRKLLDRTVCTSTVCVCTGRMLASKNKLANAFRQAAEAANEKARTRFYFDLFYCFVEVVSEISFSYLIRGLATEFFTLDPSSDECSKRKCWNN